MNNTEIIKHLEPLKLSDKQLKSHLKRLQILTELNLTPTVSQGYSDAGWKYVQFKVKTLRRDVSLLVFTTKITPYLTERLGGKYYTYGKDPSGSRKEIEYLLTKWIGE